MTLLSRLKAAAKALGGVTHPTGNPLYNLLLPRTRVDYKREVGDGLGSNVFMSPLTWMSRAFLESPIVMATAKGDGEQIDAAHELCSLLAKPNPHYSGHALTQAMLYSWFFEGNVYLLKNRGASKSGPVKELWYVPHWLMEPKWDGNDFISYYEYRPGRGSEYKDPSDVVHLRYGIDPHNVRKGLAPVHCLLREIFNDDEAANQVARLLANGCIPGVVISPKDGSTVGDADLKATKQYVLEKFGGDNKGAPLALGAPTEIQQFGYDPKTMDLSAIRNVSEERVCALMGMRASVVGFGTGLETTKVGATMQEDVKLSWTGGVIPTQELLAGELTRNLGTDFGLKPTQRLTYDRRRVYALQDDLTKQTERMLKSVGGPWRMVSEAREQEGLEVKPEHEVFLVPGAAIPTRTEELDKPRPTPPSPFGLPPQADPEADPEAESAVDEEVAKALKARGLKSPTKAAVRGKHTEFVRLLDGMAPALAKAVSDFMDAQTARFVKAISAGHSWKQEEHDHKELATVLFPALKRAVQAGLSHERAFVATLGKAAAFEAKRCKAAKPSTRPEKWAQVNALRWAQDINRTTYAAVDEALQDALEGGAGVSEAAKLVAESLDMEKDYRVTRIAQTETLAALNEGSLEAYRENSQVEGKGWLPTRDQFTRESHIQAGEVYNEANPIPVSEDFVVGSASGPAPGQMGDPAEDCNCRCAIFPVVKETP